VGGDSVVDISNPYGLNGDRIPAVARFSAPVQTGPGAYPASCAMATKSFPGGKATGAWRLTPTPM